MVTGTTSPSSSAAAAAPRPGEREPSSTVQPRPASRRAEARPMPLFAPVTRAIVVSVLRPRSGRRRRATRTGRAGDRQYQAGRRAGGDAGDVDRTELGTVLRNWRERLRPADVGLPAGARRRTPGLRREEVAGLAGMSVDYLTRLEQGRGPQPSEARLRERAPALRGCAAGVGLGPAAVRRRARPPVPAGRQRASGAGAGPQHGPAGRAA